ncbi:MAG: carotenoid biosynthesis protein [Actinomycetota bacterium]|nr:carotenoid biosynthesis protein [Actinomycetota bacterium]
MIPKALLVTPRLLLVTSALFVSAGYFVVHFPNVPGAAMGSFVSTLLIALPSLVALWCYLGARGAALSLLALSAFGYIIETIGVASGFPYGSFHYGDSLGIKLGGLVPYLLPLSWVPLVLGGVAAALPRGGKEVPRQRWALWILSAAVLLTLIDGVLDPGAASLGFWVWPQGGAYYGVPVTNYLGWLFSSTLATAVLLAIGHRKWGGVPPLPGLLDSALLALAFWTGVSLFSGLLFPTALGITLFYYILHRRALLAPAPFRGY